MKTTIAVVGGTGVLGSRLVAELERRGHAVRALSRRGPWPADLTSGVGLGPALDGCEVVVDASNQPPTARKGTVLVDGTKRLLAAGEQAGVRHHVVVGIVGAEQVPSGYYRLKTEQEELVRTGSLPFTIFRSTQFHELLDMMLGSLARLRVLPVPRAPLQPVAVAEAATALAGVAIEPPRGGRFEIGGPETADARQLASAWRQARGRRAPILPLRLPGRAGRALRDGSLVCRAPDVRGTISFDSWLRTTS